MLEPETAVMVVLGLFEMILTTPFGWVFVSPALISLTAWSYGVSYVNVSATALMIPAGWMLGVSIIGTANRVLR